MLVADEDVEQTQVIRIGIGMLYFWGNYEGVAGVDGMATAFDDMGALAIEDDDQFDKVVIVQGSIRLIGLTANSYALVGDLKPGGDRLIAVVCPDFFLGHGNIDVTLIHIRWLYALVAILKKQLNVDRSLAQILQILTGVFFEQVYVLQLLTKFHSENDLDRLCNQLILFDLYGQ